MIYLYLNDRTGDGGGRTEHDYWWREKDNAVHLVHNIITLFPVQGCAREIVLYIS